MTWLNYKHLPVVFNNIRHDLFAWVKEMFLIYVLYVYYNISFLF